MQSASKESRKWLAWVGWIQKHNFCDMQQAKRTKHAPYGTVVSPSRSEQHPSTSSQNIAAKAISAQRYLRETREKSADGGYAAAWLEKNRTSCKYLVPSSCSRSARLCSASACLMNHTHLHLSDRVRAWGTKVSLRKT